VVEYRQPRADAANVEQLGVEDDRGVARRRRDRVRNGRLDRREALPGGRELDRQRRAGVRTSPYPSARYTAFARLLALPPPAR
jgi:hypothetical protein